MADEPTGTGGDATTQTAQELQRAVERAQRFEGQVVNLQKEMERFKGVDLDKLKADSEALAQLMKDNAKKSGNQDDIDALLTKKEKEIRDELQSKIEEWQGKATTYEQQVRELTIIDKGFSKVSSIFNDDTHDFIKDIFRRSVELDKDGHFVVKDKDGKARYSAKAANKLMTIEELAEEIAEKHPSFARATQVKAGRQNGQAAGPSADEVSRYLKMSPAERAKLPPTKRMELAKQAIP